MPRLYNLKEVLINRRKSLITCALATPLNARELQGEVQWLLLSIMYNVFFISIVVICKISIWKLYGNMNDLNFNQYIVSFTLQMLCSKCNVKRQPGEVKYPNKMAKYERKEWHLSDSCLETSTEYRKA